ncbi:MAG: nitroreductase [Erysipelotrichia bacterium]|nr:nitroreductase [Erysipelotrichia bacterium]
MNDVIRELNERKSIRAFTDQMISAEERDAILNAAVQAPTAGNQQLYAILNITDQSLKNRLSETCDHQPMIARAKLVLIFCADCSRWLELYKEAGCDFRTPGTGDLILACEDACIAAQNAVTAAWSLGIGSCYIGDILENVEIHQKLLHLPEYTMPVCMVIFGYPSAEVMNQLKPQRADLDLIVHENAYHSLSSQQLRRTVQQRLHGETFEQWTAAFCNRKYDSSFSREMSRSADIYLKQFQKEDR